MCTPLCMGIHIHSTASGCLYFQHSDDDHSNKAPLRLFHHRWDCSVTGQTQGCNSSGPGTPQVRQAGPPAVWASARILRRHPEEEHCPVQQFCPALGLSLAVSGGVSSCNSNCTEKKRESPLQVLLVAIERVYIVSKSPIYRNKVFSSFLS